MRSRPAVPAREPTGWPAGPEPADWSYGPEPDDRRWWMPILVGVIALILLGVLVVAGWVVVESIPRDAPGPPAPGVTTSGPPSATAGTEQPTSSPPTTGTPSPTGAPSPTGTPTTGTRAMPEVVGLPVREAVDLLDRSGLVPRVRFRASDEAPGTVLESDPPAGREVVPGDEVFLVVARPRPNPPPTGVPGPTPPPTGNG